MKSKLFAPALFAWFVVLTPQVAGHDPAEVPPKVSNLVTSLRLVAVEITRDRYLLLLQNASDKPLRRLEWSITHEDEQQRGVFTAAASGLIAPGTVFDAPIPQPPPSGDGHDVEHLSEEEAEAHRPQVVLEVGLFEGGAAEGDPNRVILAIAHEEGARLALGPVLDSLKQLQERGGGIRSGLRETVERVRALALPAEGDSPRLSGTEWRAAAEGFRAEVEAFAVSLALLEQAADDDALVTELRKIVSNAERTVRK